MSRTPRALPRSPAQHRGGQAATSTISMNTTPTVYSFSRDASAPPPRPAMSTTLLPDTPPRPTGSASSLLSRELEALRAGVSNSHVVSPPRRQTPPSSAVTTPSTTVVSSSHQFTVPGHHQQQRGSSPAAGGVLSPFVGGRASAATPSSSTAPVPAPPPPAPTAAYGNAAGSNSGGSLDKVLAESMANFKRAEIAEGDAKRAEASLREINKDYTEKLRTAHGTIHSLQLERDNLRRANLEQSDTIAKLREQIAQLGKRGTASDRLRQENVQLKERLREADTKLREADGARAQLHQRLGEQERSAHTRAHSVQDLRGQLHSKDELVSTLSETVRARDATIAKLSSEFQITADELGREQSDRKRDMQHLEQALVEGKERELVLRQQLSDAQADADAMRRDRDDWRGQCEAAQIRCAAIAQRAMDDIVELELHSRSFLEITFAHTAEDHCRSFSCAAQNASMEHQASLGKVARLLDDTDSLMRELTYAQDVARTGVQDRELLGGEVGAVRDLAGETMRSLELLTSSASWRRAVIETLIPDEIAGSVAQIRAGVAEVVHRCNVISKRALRKN